MGKRGPPNAVETHPQRAQIEYLIANGATQKAIGKKFGIDPSAVFRHKKRMTPALIASLRWRKPEHQIDLAELKKGESESLLIQLLAVDGHLNTAMSMCLEAGDANGISRIAARLQQNAELKARMLGELQTGDQHLTVNLWGTPEGTRAIRAIMVALTNYPEARKAVAAELRAIDAPTVDVTPLLEGIRDAN